MTYIRGLVVCVGYDDLLEITLPRNMPHMKECVVVTSPEDTATHELAIDCGAYVFKTDAFTRYGAKFNKGLAIEEALEWFGRSGWMLIWDADTLFPPQLKLDGIAPQNLYGPNRLILENPKKWFPEFNWRNAVKTSDREFPGFFQLFHASDPHLINQRPWYDVSFTHAGGCDSYFQNLWPASNKIRLPWNVLHLGPRDRNWFGRTSPRMDDSAIPQVGERLTELNNLHGHNGWNRKRQVTVPEFKDRIIVPGYPVSTYKWHNSFPPVDTGAATQ